MIEITQEYLKEILFYCPESGLFFWRNPTSSKVVKGQRAGTLDNNGYVRIKINKRKYQAHRLAWLYLHGVWPHEDTDHINRVKNDNRMCNLRAVTRSVNRRNTPHNRNNKAGFKGVHQRENGKWRASFWDGVRNINIGQFDTAEDAAAAYAAFTPEPVKQEQGALL